MEQNSQLRMELVQKMEEAFGVRANAIRVNYYRTNKAGSKTTKKKNHRSSEKKGVGYLNGVLFCVFLGWGLSDGWADGRMGLKIKNEAAKGNC